jgi:hypothetical protein
MRQIWHHRVGSKFYVHVHSQLVDGFKHAYGSALAAFELGVLPADLLFRANEYAEAIFSGRSGSQPFYLDARKDLSNNAYGRSNGERARKLGLSGPIFERRSAAGSGTRSGL